MNASPEAEAQVAANIAVSIAPTIIQEVDNGNATAVIRALLHHVAGVADFLGIQGTMEGHFNKTGFSLAIARQGAGAVGAKPEAN